MHRIALSLAALALVAAACGDAGSDPSTARDSLPPIGPGPTTPASTVPASPATAPSGELQGLTLEPIVLKATKPVLVTAPPGDPRLFLVEQDGRIRLLADGVAQDPAFLDIASEVGSGALEQGLLGLAFHPRYAENERFFVYLTNEDGDTEIREYRVGDQPDLADVGSARTLLTVDQPADNHNGGTIQFGPDGYLYIALGDGGGANDQFGNGQRPDTLLGTILRIDVDAAEPYAIPPDNPFAAGVDGAPEVWAFGLRNPWRFTIDAVDGLIYIGDVGQASVEEIDVAPVGAAGLNYGWSIAEGDRCFEAPECDTAGFTVPALSYEHSDGCSIIGGQVYRGTAIPEIDGHYFYSDWCRGWVRSLRYDQGRVVEQWDWTEDLDVGGARVLSFGADASGELYVAADDGSVYRIAPVR